VGVDSIKIRLRGLKTSSLTIAVALMLVCVSCLAIVHAPPPPSTLPIPLSQYGIVSVYSSLGLTLGTIKIQVTSDGSGSFYVLKLLVFMNLAQQTDLTLYTVSIDGFYTVSLSQYYAPQTPKVVVIPAGFTMGEVVSTLPSYLSSMLAKGPNGNPSILVNGGTGNGLTVQLQFATPTSGGTIGAEAIAFAPVNNTISVSLTD